MKWAVDEAGNRITATTSGAMALEPGTSWPVRAKVGSIVVPHWARLPGGTPDPWSEPETEWHRAWKERLVPDSHQEHTFKGGPAGYHRADAIGKGGIVVEFQHSSINVADIEAREAFYVANAPGMIWVFDAREWNFQVRGAEWQWKHPRKSLWSVSCPMFLDLGERGLLEVTDLEPEIPCYLSGNVWAVEDFVAEYGVPEGTPFEAPQPPTIQRGPDWPTRMATKRAAIEAQAAAMFQASELTRLRMELESARNVAEKHYARIRNLTRELREAQAKVSDLSREVAYAQASGYGPRPKITSFGFEPMAPDGAYVEPRKARAEAQVFVFPQLGPPPPGTPKTPRPDWEKQEWEALVDGLDIE